MSIDTAGSASDQVRAAAQESDWPDRIGRAGLVARGVVYLLVGVLAFRVAWGDRSEAADKSGALHLLVQQPFGQALLTILAIGLLMYAAWSFLSAVIHRDAKDHKEWAKRVGYAGRGVVYAVLGLSAVSLLLDGSGGGGDQEQGATAMILGWGPVGQLFIGAIGLGFVAAGVWNAYRAFTLKYEKHLATHQMSDAQQHGVQVLGIAGLLGRFVAFVAIGWFVVNAAVNADASEPLGLDESLRTLADGAIGPLGLSLVALGLFLYGAFSFAVARWGELDN